MVSHAYDVSDLNVETHLQPFNPFVTVSWRPPSHNICLLQGESCT